MYWKLFLSIFPATSDKVCCYHCGESVKRRRIVSVEFNGASREVCCHGCAVILRTIEQCGMLTEYLDSKQSK